MTRKVRKVRKWRVVQGDCRVVLRELPENCVDAVGCDPPYELGFMGKSWDKAGVAFDSGTWGEVLRVLKPGGHMLAFGGSRTFHRIAVAIEDAGFEIRDTLMWIYGTGFPKSMNVGKAIDKAAGAERKIGPVDPARAGRLVNQRGSYVTDAGWSAGSRGVTIDPPATPEAQQWEGWGTALKPAYEPIILARKPIKGTVARNVLEYGVGGLNIDGTRIEVGDETISVPQSNPKAREGVVGTDFGISGSSVERFQKAQRESAQKTQEKGRWPANVLLDEEAAAMLDAQADKSSSPKPRKMRRGATTGTSIGGHATYGTGAYHESIVGYGDSGGPSRFFYTAKASKSEREAGLDHLDTQLYGQSSGAQGALNRGEASYQQTDASTGLNTIKARKNIHPTVKPIALMEYLTRLITPPRGIVLDPFMGSGSTGIAATREGFRFVGIDADEEHGYCELAAARIGYWSGVEGKVDDVGEIVRFVGL